jgi:ornithine cyclodeaminase
MIRYLDVSAVTALIQKNGIEETIAALAAYIVEDFRRWPEFSKAPRSVHHSPMGVNELMPIGDARLYGFKYVNGHPKNIDKGLATVLAFGVLAEVETGVPLLLCDLTIGTALRTAATSAIAARMLAREDSTSMAVIGCGAQSEFQILAFKSILGITDFRIYDTDPAAMDKLERNLAGYDKITIIKARSIHDAVKGADIITTITADKTNGRILTPDIVHSGVHINAVGGDCPGKTELHPDILKTATVVVEYEPQTRIEGEIQQLPEDFAVTELWRILAGTAHGRTSASEITIFDSVGFALEDFSTLRYLNDVAAAQNAGSLIDLIPMLSDPKDLFGLLQRVPMLMPQALKAAILVERRP